MAKKCVETENLDPLQITYDIDIFHSATFLYEMLQMFKKTS